MDKTLERIISLMPHDDSGNIAHGARKVFAESIGLKSGNLISDWLNGRSNSYKNYVYEIALKYDVPVDWLLGNTDEKKKPTTVSDDGRETDKRRRALKLIVDNMSSEEVEAFLKLFDR